MRFLSGKKIVVSLFLGIGVILTSLSGCLEGPVGPAGKNGLTDTLIIRDSTFIKDSIRIKDSLLLRDTTYAMTACNSCHATAKMDSITTQYQMSYHFTRGVVNNSSRFCERCHTSEGFQELAQNGLPFAQTSIPNATRIQCQTCHKMNGFDMVDTAASILRTTSPVILSYNNSYSTSAWQSQKTTDFGEVNNLCASCHQIRGATSFTYMDTTKIFGTDTSAKNSYRRTTDSTFNQLPYFPVSKFAPTDSVQYLATRSFAVHDGNQTNMSKGINAYEYPGVSYNGKDTSTWKHLNAECTDCHMATKFNAADSTGGHTFKINKADPKCNVCHNLKTKITDDSTTIAGLLVQLGDLLVARKIMTKKVNSNPGQLPYTYTVQTSHDFYGKLYGDTAGTGTDPVYYATTASNNSVNPTSGLLVYDNMVTWAKDKAPTGLATPWKGRIGRSWTGGEFGAAYNFGFVYTTLYQHVYGIHNPAYCKSVLNASINWLNAHP